MNKIDWEKIKLEYIMKGTSYRKLAEKHGVSLRRLAEVAKKEEWVKQREKSVIKVSTKAQRKAEEKKAALADRLLSASEKLLMKAEQVLDLEEPLPPRDLKAMSGMLIETRTLLGLHDEFEVQERALRIRKIEAEIAAAEKMVSAVENRMVVEWVKPPWESEAPPPGDTSSVTPLRETGATPSPQGEGKEKR